MNAEAEYNASVENGDLLVEQQPPESAEEDLGPFDPPADYQFEPELRGAAPRPIPKEFHQSAYARLERGCVAVPMAAGAFCVALSMVPGIEAMALYFVPLEYLLWIGCGALALGVLALGLYLFSPGAFAYVERGTPMVGRIRRADLCYVGTFQDFETYEYVFEFEYCPRNNADIVVEEAKTGRFTLDDLDKRELTYHVGDYVTIVSLPSHPSKPPVLYGLLGLRSDMGLAEREPSTGKASRGASTTTVALGTIAVFAGLMAMLWANYAFNKFPPLDLTLPRLVLPVLVGAAVIGGPILVYAFLAANRKRARLDCIAEAVGDVARDQQRIGWFGFRGAAWNVIPIIAVTILGGSIALGLCYSANALLDRSQAEYRPVEIEDLTVTTHRYVSIPIWRDYTIDYRFDGRRKSHTLWTTPDHIDQFEDRQAVAEIHAGWLGWPWVKTIHQQLPRKVP